jgi:hypothetical protein
MIAEQLMLLNSSMGGGEHWGVLINKERYLFLICRCSKWVGQDFQANLCSIVALLNKIHEIV